MVIVGIHSMLEYPLWYAGFLFLTGVSMGYLFSPMPSTDDLPKGQASRHLLWPARASAVGLLVLAGMGWQQFDTLRTSFKIPFTNDLAVVRAAVATALSKASGAWLFQEQLDSATLAQIEIKQENALQIRQFSEKLLHASAEPRVIQPLLWSLWYLHDLNALQLHAQRFCAAFPDVYARWYKEPIMQDMAKAAGIAPQTCKLLPLGP